MTTQTPIQLYNTLTKRKEPFAPLDPANVRMYVCGPTVYDEAHIGNARPVIVFDVLYRLLRHVYGENHVTYVRNLTDIDDKINKRAFERWDKKRPLLAEIRALTEKTAAQFHADVDALGNLRPNHEPRATEYVCDGEKRTDMVRIIEKLIARGHAYVAEGHVLFDVPSMPDYGRLARRTKDDMLAGARVDVAPYKKDPMDFVLWKPSNPETEPGWDSPWGFGRPGWHIECSAMSGALLGKTFDIHAGGIDLIFPHHENEIAQTCCAFGVEKMASVWMHNGFLQVEGEKMSKSLGNFYTINELLRTEKFGGRWWSGPTLRLAMLKTHYRQPIDWTEIALMVAEQEMRSSAIRIVEILEGTGVFNYFSGEWKASKEFDEAVPFSFLPTILSDDLNTPLAISSILANKPEYGSRDLNKAGQFFKSLEFMGLIDRRRLMIYSNGVNILREVDPLADGITNNLRAASINRDQSGVNEQVSALGRIGLQVRQFFDGCWRVRRTVEELDALHQDEIANLVSTRLAARAAKNWAESDRIRDELAAQGIILKDNKDGTTTWEVKR